MFKGTVRAQDVCTDRRQPDGARLGTSRNYLFYFGRIPDSAGGNELLIVHSGIYESNIVRYISVDRSVVRISRVYTKDVQTRYVMHCLVR